MNEAYPGQSYWHERNKNIRRAEEAFVTSEGLKEFVAKDDVLDILDALTPEDADVNHPAHVAYNQVAALNAAEAPVSQRLNEALQEAKSIVDGWAVDERGLVHVHKDAISKALNAAAVPQGAPEIRYDQEFWTKVRKLPPPATFGIIADAQPAAPAEPLSSQAESVLRIHLWETHGHGGSALYGDDGELQCKACRLWDYKREPLNELIEQVRVTSLEEGLKRLAEHGRAALSPPVESMWPKDLGHCQKCNRDINRRTHGTDLVEKLEPTPLQAKRR